MRFRIWAILYAMAVLAAALATFGGAGVFWASAVIVSWIILLGSKTVGVRLGVVLALALICLALSSVQGVREFSRRSNCMSNLKLLAFALHNYLDRHRAFPPAAIFNESDGTPMHSWRVAILPYIGRQDLYDSYNLSEPWNGPGNRKLHGELPSLGFFDCPSVAVALLTASGGEEEIDLDALAWSASGRKLNWPRILTFSTFVVLSLLPLPWAIRGWRGGAAPGEPVARG